MHAFHRLADMLKAVTHAPHQGSLFATPVHVAGYTTKDGHRVEPHMALRRKRLVIIKRPASAIADLFSAPHELEHVPVSPPSEPLPATPAPATEAAPTDTPPPIMPMIEHVTARGRTLRGVVRTDLTLGQAKAIDPYTFRKNGGFFIRDKHLADGAALGQTSGSPDTRNNEAPVSDAPPDTPAEAVKDIYATATALVDRRHKQAAKLREQADTLGAAANESMNRDRLANTRRRASMAASAYQTAAVDLRLAETMANLAAAIENGEAVHLGAVSTRADVETLDELLRAGRVNRWHKESLGQDSRARHRDWEDRHQRPIEPEDIRHATLPIPRLHGMQARDLVEAAAVLDVKRGHAAILRWLERAAADRDHGFSPTGDQVAELRSLANDLEVKARKHEKDYSGDYKLRNAARSARWSIKKVRELSASRRRYAKMGLTTDEQLQAALAEYVIYRGGTKSEDPIKQLERGLVGRKDIGIDFFPTPRALVDQLVEQADIQPGMTVLEPSAGKGDIADQARAAGGKVDVVELSATLRPLLEAKGHTVVGHDFDTFEAPAGGYDRIIMNPPFSDGKDADHVRRAYDMLKPGGRLVAITGEGIHFRQDRKAAGFREWLEERGGVSEKLPEGSFKSAFRPTGVATRVVVMDKPAKAAASDLEYRPAEPTPDMFHRKVSGPTSDHTADFTQQRVADSKMLTRWMGTLPESTLESASAFARKLNDSPMGQHFQIKRDDYGNAVISDRADYRDRHGRPGEPDGGGRWFADHKLGTDYQDLLRLIVHHAAEDGAQDWEKQHWATRLGAAERAAKQSKSEGIPLGELLRQRGHGEQPMTKGGPFATAVRKAVAHHRGPVAPDEIAPHWPGSTKDDVLDMLHACPSDYTPAGDRWLPAAAA